MKKFLVLIAVLAMAGFSTVALAADVSLSGFIGVRARNFDNLDFNKNLNDKTVDTQEKVRLEVNVKASDDAKGKLSVENYWDTWGRFEQYQGSGNDATATGAATGEGQNNFLRIREAWLSFNVPGVPVNVTAGHQLLQLGNGWFFRSKYFGSDAWVVANVTGNNTIAFVDVKIADPDTRYSDDVDAYVLLDVLKLNENMTAGINITYANDRKNSLQPLLGTPAGNTKETQAQNIGLTFDGKIGPVNLNAEADVQMGKAKSNDGKFKGNQIVIQGNVPVDPVKINFTVARGSGKSVTDTSNDFKQMVTFLDIDTHYTYLYEYKLAGPCGIHTGFCNTTAISAGVSADVAKSLNVGLDVWYLQATEKVANHNGPGTTSDLGTEIDGTINWKIYDNLSWRWNLAYLDPGDGLGKDAATGIQGYLIFKF